MYENVYGIWELPSPSSFRGIEDQEGRTERQEKKPWKNRFKKRTRKPHRFSEQEKTDSDSDSDSSDSDNAMPPMPMVIKKVPRTRKVVVEKEAKNTPKKLKALPSHKKRVKSSLGWIPPDDPRPMMRTLAPPPHMRRPMMRRIEPPRRMMSRPAPIPSVVHVPQTKFVRDNSAKLKNQKKAGRCYVQ